MRLKQPAKNAGLRKYSAKSACFPREVFKSRFITIKLCLIARMRILFGKAREDNNN